jgi:WD40 repeat protein
LQLNPQVVTFLHGKNPIYSLDVSPDGKIVASLDSANYHWTFWDVETRQTIEPPLADKENHAQINLVDFSPDSKVMTIRLADQLVYLWDVVKRQTRRQYRSNDDPIKPLCTESAEI